MYYKTLEEEFRMMYTGLSLETLTSQLLYLQNLRSKYDPDNAWNHGHIVRIDHQIRIIEELMLTFR